MFAIVNAGLAFAEVTSGYPERGADITLENEENFKKI